MTKNIRKIAVFVVLGILMIAVAGCGNDTAAKQPTLNEIKQVCEMSTLECFYHGVAKSQLKNSKVLSTIGVKDPEIWLEYDAEVKLGVDVSDMKVEYNENEVTVTMPEAKVLSVDIDDHSYAPENIIAEKVLLKQVKPGTKEMNKAIEDTVEDLKELTEDNADQLQAAKNRAEKLIENYICKVGEANGVQYTVIFKDKK